MLQLQGTKSDCFGQTDLNLQILDCRIITYFVHKLYTKQRFYNYF